MAKSKNTRSPNDIDAHVGNRLKILRREHDLSQSQLGNIVDVTFQQIQKYEKGRNRISVSRLWKFCEYFNVCPDFFFEGLSGNSCVQNSDTASDVRRPEGILKKIHHKSKISSESAEALKLA